MKKIAAVALAAAGHYALTHLVVAAVLHLGADAAFQATRPLPDRLLIAFSKALYFPIISLALYPRQFFPGGWIQVPILANSLLWGLVLVLVWGVVRRK